ncbi:glycosyltransferase family 4 protein [Rhodococcus sp. A14]|uniref:glycosyltransferase n=1 Tax=Rhodococcus sp. A14 TaxID=1194106 RepID=UPI001420CDBB|nr:glycosyltransferase family 4 protein [Rhodococcus sp. A14]
MASSELAGGAEEYIYRLYRELADTGAVDVTLIGSLPHWDASVGECVPSGVTRKLTRRHPMFGQAIRTIRSVPEMVRALDVAKPDIVHVQYMKEKLTLPRLIRERTPILWTEHGPLPTNFPPGARRYLSWQSRSARVIAVSEGVKESLSRSGIISEVIPNPFPDCGLEPEQVKAGPRCEPVRRVVGYAGRVHESKRVDLLVDVAAQLPEVDFVIAGDGPAKGMLETRASSNVKFLGHVDDMAMVYPSLDLLVIPGGQAAREGSPMVMLEARCFGLNVIVANDCHALPEAMDLGCSGFEPTVRGLGLAIGEAINLPRRSLPTAIREARSVRNWARGHLDVMKALIAV